MRHHRVSGEPSSLTSYHQRGPAGSCSTSSAWATSTGNFTPPASNAAWAARAPDYSSRPSRVSGRHFEHAGTC